MSSAILGGAVPVSTAGAIVPPEESVAGDDVPAGVSCPVPVPVSVPVPVPVPNTPDVVVENAPVLTLGTAVAAEFCCAPKIAAELPFALLIAAEFVSAAAVPFVLFDVLDKLATGLST